MFFSTLLAASSSKPNSPLSVYSELLWVKLATFTGWTMKLDWIRKGFVGC